MSTELRDSARISETRVSEISAGGHSLRHDGSPSVKLKFDCPHKARNRRGPSSFYQRVHRVVTGSLRWPRVTTCTKASRDSVHPRTTPPPPTPLKRPSLASLSRCSSAVQTAKCNFIDYVVGPRRGAARPFNEPFSTMPLINNNSAHIGRGPRREGMGLADRGRGEGGGGQERVSRWRTRGVDGRSRRDREFRVTFSLRSPWTRAWPDRRETLCVGGKPSTGKLTLSGFSSDTSPSIHSRQRYYREVASVYICIYT